VGRYEDQGPSGLASRKRGRPGNHQLPPGLAEHAIALIRERYADFGPTLAAEKLRECHGVVLGKETVRSLMTSAGLWIPRNRRACLGELIQIDGSSDHAWFEDRAPACTLLVFIDDATSRLMQLHFVPTESAFAYSRPPAPISSITASPLRSTATRRHLPAGGHARVPRAWGDAVRPGLSTS